MIISCIARMRQQENYHVIIQVLRGELRIILNTIIIINLQHMD